jgi:hypothetical protein
VEVTHPFHPLRGQRFELIDVRKTWGEDRAFLRGPSGIMSLPVGWTDVEPPDPFVVQAAGRALCRTVDLLAIAAFMRGAG